VAHEQEEDEDREIPGKVKSYDGTRRLLVVSLLNGKDRSFLLANDVKVFVKGTPSKQGLKDPALRAGTPVTVLVGSGGPTSQRIACRPAARDKKAA